MVDATHPQYTRREREGKLKFSTKFYQGIGAVPDTIKNWAFNTFALLFYNQVLGLDAFMVSVVLAIAMVFDAVTDPVDGEEVTVVETGRGDLLIPSGEPHRAEQVAIMGGALVFLCRGRLVHLDLEIGAQVGAAAVEKQQSLLDPLAIIGLVTQRLDARPGALADVVVETRPFP